MLILQYPTGRLYFIAGSEIIYVCLGTEQLRMVVSHFMSLEVLRRVLSFVAQSILQNTFVDLTDENGLVLCVWLIILYLLLSLFFVVQIKAML